MHWTWLLIILWNKANIDIHKSPKTAKTCRRRRRKKTKDLISCKSIDANVTLENMSLFETNHNTLNQQNKSNIINNKPKEIDDMLNMLHCQAKFIEDKLYY